ncbi:5'-3' exonuclease [Rudaeicoccus suwonensis]|uniref:5'-3' exonuclease n=1 Tax=Rudaeicoccus suwonensis TaxID=657409 RepID=A0A561EB24_9MICO|nr:5'-3' exonuclease [Rudaeicoccus suwonensis]TWE12787.1 5'-3' exonuclease [Rudaeicoccus suwonensis]
MKRRLLLLDSASLYFRAFYGVPDRRRNPSDLPNNAIRGFVDMIATLVNDHAPTDLVACWDNDWRPQFRVDAIPSYKAHRVTEGTAGAEESPDDLTPQVPVIVEVLRAIGICRLGVDGYEADDVIGSLAVRAHGVSEVDVVTGDRDLFQLVDDEQSVRVLYTAKGGVRTPDVVDQAFLQQKYDVSSGAAYADMAVLRGDASDGLPGVSGIGEKTAAALINRYGDLASLRAAVSSGDPTLKGAQRARLEAASAYLDVAPTVVQVARNIDIPTGFDPSVPTRVADPARLDELVAQADLRTPVSRLLAALSV